MPDDHVVEQLDFKHFARLDQVPGQFDIRT
jgi:hypothetical protein